MTWISPGKDLSGGQVCHQSQRRQAGSGVAGQTALCLWWHQLSSWDCNCLRLQVLCQIPHQIPLGMSKQKTPYWQGAEDEEGLNGKGKEQLRWYLTHWIGSLDYIIKRKKALISYLFLIINNILSILILSSERGNKEGSAWRITSSKRPEYWITGELSKLCLLSRVFTAGWEGKWIHVKAVEKRKQCCFAQRLQPSRAFQLILQGLWKVSGKFMRLFKLNLSSSIYRSRSRKKPV